MGIALAYYPPCGGSFPATPVHGAALSGVLGAPPDACVRATRPAVPNLRDSEIARILPAALARALPGHFSLTGTMLYISPKIRLGEGAEGTGVFATEPIRPDERIVGFRLEFRRKPGRHTLQVDNAHHIAPTGREDDYLNHSCRPNAYVDFRDWSVRAAEPIRHGEEVTIDYNTTEWDEPFPFDCRCGAPNCVGHVRGFRHLSAERQASMLPRVSPYLRRRYEQRRREREEARRNGAEAVRRDGAAPPRFP